uniref:Uncharacterized protein n=1 Tax=Glossina austeni TaxID=7395 RepID=A0A1A9V074_GLOAU
MIIKPTILQSPRTNVNTTTSTTTTTATSPTTTITCFSFFTIYILKCIMFLVLDGDGGLQVFISRAPIAFLVEKPKISREYTHDYNAIQQNLTLYTLQLVTQIVTGRGTYAVALLNRKLIG